MDIYGRRDLHDTPCVGICSTTNVGDNVCKGCGRTAEEVINWNSYSKSRKMDINLRLRNRKLCVLCPNEILENESRVSIMVDGEVHTVHRKCRDAKRPDLAPSWTRDKLDKIKEVGDEVTPDEKRESQ